MRFQFRNTDRSNRADRSEPLLEQPGLKLKLKLSENHSVEANLTERGLQQLAPWMTLLLGLGVVGLLAWGNFRLEQPNSQPPALPAETETQSQQR